MTDRRSVLLLANDSRDHAANVLQHIGGLVRYSRHDIRTFNPVGDIRPRDLRLAAFDAVVIHYSIAITLETYLPQWLAEQVAAFDGLKVQFIQDEYRWIDAITAKIRELGIGLLFTAVPPDEVAKVYGPRVPGATTVTTLTGYVPEQLVRRAVRPIRERPIDVGYRGRTVPFWLGRFGQEKLEIGRGFRARARDTGLRCDIAWSENDRIYGEAWNEFMASCRATLGTESGASIADYDGSVERGVKDYLASHPTASFEEVEREVLAPYEGNLALAVISPRQFEAAALRTALVLFPGGYSGILEAHRHYIPLEKDFSNMDEVAAKLRDHAALQAMVDRTYDEVAMSERWSLRTFVAEFDDLLAANSRARGRAVPYLGRPRAARRARRALLRRTYDAVKTMLALEAIRRDPALRRITRAYARDPDARRGVDLGALLEDLLKLSIVADARRGAHGFGVVTRYDERARRLVLASIPSQAQQDGTVRRDLVAEALRRGDLELVWSHVSVGDSVRLPLAAGRGLQLRVGYHGVEGAHSFRAIARFAPRAPELVLAALEPVL